MSIQESAVSTQPEDRLIRGLISITEQDIACHGPESDPMPSRDAGLALDGWCDFTTMIVCHFARRNSMSSRMVQAAYMHLYLSGQPNGVPREDVFGHVLGIVSIDRRQIDGLPYLVDRTFGQFCVHKTISQGNIDSGISTDDPLAQMLVTHGYAPLTDDTLRQYLRLTSSNRPDSFAYIDTATVEALFKVVPEVRPWATDNAIASGSVYHERDKGCVDYGCIRPNPLLNAQT